MTRALEGLGLVGTTDGQLGPSEVSADGSHDGFDACCLAGACHAAGSLGLTCRDRPATVTTRCVCRPQRGAGVDATAAGALQPSQEQRVAQRRVLDEPAACDTRAHKVPQVQVRTPLPRTRNTDPLSQGVALHVARRMVDWAHCSDLAAAPSHTCVTSADRAPVRTRRRRRRRQRPAGRRPARRLVRHPCRPPRRPPQRMVQNNSLRVPFLRTTTPGRSLPWPAPLLGARPRRRATLSRVAQRTVHRGRSASACPSPTGSRTACGRRTHPIRRPQWQTRRLHQRQTLRRVAQLAAVTLVCT